MRLAKVNLVFVKRWAVADHKRDDRSFQVSLRIPHVSQVIHKMHYQRFMRSLWRAIDSWNTLNVFVRTEYFHIDSCCSCEFSFREKREREKRKRRCITIQIHFFILSAQIPWMYCLRIIKWPPSKPIFIMNDILPFFPSFTLSLFLSLARSLVRTAPVLLLLHKQHNI